jgi:4-hydroxy-tetrahydrodipicolinate reductase
MGRAVLDRAGEDARFEVAAAITIPGDPLLGQRVRVGAKEIAFVDRLTETCDVLIDFTLPAGTMHWLDICEKNNTPMVIGATGHDEHQSNRIRAAAEQIPIVKATNFSLGVNALLGVAKQLASTLGSEYDIEIVETHHRRKIDAPSGTAISFLEAVQSGVAPAPHGDDARSCVAPASSRCESGPEAVVHGRHGATGPRKKGEIGVHAVRMGDVVGHHEIHFGGPGETVTIAHTALSRTTFAAGALHAAAWIIDKPPGLYAMSDVLRLANAKY